MGVSRGGGSGGMSSPTNEAQIGDPVPTKRPNATEVPALRFAALRFGGDGRRGRKLKKPL
jgi:hypothetical protein